MKSLLAMSLLTLSLSGFANNNYRYIDGECWTCSNGGSYKGAGSFECQPEVSSTPVSVNAGLCGVSDAPLNPLAPQRELIAPSYQYYAPASKYQASAPSPVVAQPLVVEETTITYQRPVVSTGVSTRAAAPLRANNYLSGEEVLNPNRDIQTVNQEISKTESLIMELTRRLQNLRAKKKSLGY